MNPCFSSIFKLVKIKFLFSFYGLQTIIFILLVFLLSKS
eukprot:UN19175